MPPPLELSDLCLASTWPMKKCNPTAVGGKEREGKEWEEGKGKVCQRWNEAMRCDCAVTGLGWIKIPFAFALSLVHPLLRSSSFFARVSHLRTLRLLDTRPAFPRETIRRHRWVAFAEASGSGCLKPMARSRLCPTPQRGPSLLVTQIQQH